MERNGCPSLPILCLNWTTSRCHASAASLNQYPEPLNNKCVMKFNRLPSTQGKLWIPTDTKPADVQLEEHSNATLSIDHAGNHQHFLLKSNVFLCFMKITCLTRASGKRKVMSKMYHLIARNCFTCKLQVYVILDLLRDLIKLKIHLLYSYGLSYFV